MDFVYVFSCLAGVLKYVLNILNLLLANKAGLGLIVFQEPQFYKLPYSCYLCTVHNGCSMQDVSVESGSYGNAHWVSKITNIDLVYTKFSLLLHEI